MGFLKTLVFVVVPSISYSVYISYRLGNHLPTVSRKFGNNIGMFYRYTKVVIKNSKPNTDNSKLMFYMKKSEFQSMNLARETTREFLNLKNESKKLVPEELTNDPFEKFRLKSETIDKAEAELIDGTTLLKSIFEEEIRIVEKNKKKKENEKFFNEIN